ncbi:motility associated factor glycosyltransferase family protein [Vampirovibrio sp.]|uniref:motility associated factor glycosyltransferase family protein n=1 Tax=Vampirovibrio sp. TaxID=2717857 RepID=UPI0035930021
MYYEQNIQALLATNPLHAATVKHLEAATPITDFELLACPDGGFTLKYRGVFLHDPHSPFEETRRMIAEQATLMADRVHVLLGVGLGYLLDELSQKSPGQIIIYEPDRALLRFVLENVDLAHLLALPRVALFCDQLEFLTALRKKLYSQYKLDVLTLPGCASLFADEIEPLMAQITRMELFRIQDFKTGEHFHVQWIQQFFENSSNFGAMETMDALAGQFAGKPALVISRGPSLDAMLPHLKTMQGAAVLIAVGGALHRLYDAGITPDFALFYDANGMREQVHGLPDSYLREITFVVSPFTQPTVFQIPSRGKLLMLAQNNTQFVDFLDEAFSRKHLRLGGGGTVSIIGFQMAQVLQCDPIVLVGQDLAFPNRQVYAGGVEMRLNEQGQLDLETSETLYAAPYALTNVMGQDGQELPTLQSYKSFLIHLEEMALENAKKEKPTTLWNASLGGAHIEGFPLRHLETLSAEFSNWKTSYALMEPPGHSVSDAALKTKDLLAAVQAFELEVGQHIQFWRELGLKVSRNQSDIRKLAQAMLEANKQVYARFSGYPFAAYVLIHELRTFQDRFQATLALSDGPFKAQKELKALCKQSADLLENQVLPSLKKAMAGYQAALASSSLH